MKKILLLSLCFAFVLGLVGTSGSTALALSPGIPDCLPGALYSHMTGKPCNSVINPNRACHVFNKNLMSGANGEDVRQLQILLNQDTDTRIALSGAGSPGNETIYFGPATMRAVMKFQEKHSFDVLAPAGLVRGTGFVGRLTLQKLNRLCNKPVDPQAPVIQSISGPSKLAVGEKGTWKINAYDPNNGSQLNYSILWGDEMNFATSPSAGAPADMRIIVHNAETSHVFTQAGTYTQIFTVTNLAGKSVTGKTTVQVGDVVTSGVSYSISTNKTSYNANDIITIPL